MKLSKLIVVLILALLAIPAWAEYTIFMKNGTIYKAKEKWKVVNGQATITLTTGTVLTFDPGLIDVVQTERSNDLGLGDARLIATEQRKNESPQSRSSLGDQVRLKRKTAESAEESSSSSDIATPLIDRQILSMLERAYENVGIFGATLKPLESRTIQVQLAANNEDDVMKAISATSFVMTRKPEIKNVLLLMATMTGGSAGKFDMTRDDAEALVNKQLTWQSYYIQRVMF